MACRFTYNGKVYDEDGLAKALREMPLDVAAKFVPNVKSIPAPPLKTSWPELALKRMIRYAAEHGYEKIAWTPGEVQAARYDLSKHVNEIEYIKNSDGTYHLSVIDKKGEGVAIPSDHMTLAEVEGFVGKEIAEKIAKEEGKKYRGHEGYTLDGLDLKVGGEGMKGFYDKILPAAANKLVKKFGGKVERGEIGYGGNEYGNKYGWQKDDGDGRFYITTPDGRTGESFATRQEAQSRMTSLMQDATTHQVHTLDINPELRTAATEQGFPLFQGRARHGEIAPGPERRVIRLMKNANASTFMHESSHDWLEQIVSDAAHPLAPEALKTDLATIRQWMGTEPNEKPAPDWSFSVRQHEKFARGFEQYLREGIAPSPQLASVFAKFKAWLLNIYQTLKGLGEPINEDIRGVFGRMLATEPQRTVIAAERAKQPQLPEIHEADAAHAAPHEAEPHRDRIVAERDQQYEALPEDIRREHEAAIAETAKLEAEGYQPGSAADATGEAGPGRAERIEVGGAGDQPQPEPTGGAGGAEHGAQQPGGAATERQGPDLSGAQQRPGSGKEPESVPLAGTPAANFNIGGESFNIGKDGNIRTENITSIKQFMEAIEESKERIGGGGKMTMGEMIDTAERVGLQPKDIDEQRLATMFGGTVDLAPKIFALRTAVEQQTQTVHGLMKRIRDGGDDAVVAEFAKESARFDMMMSVLSSVTTETGRALGMAFRNLDNLNGAKDLERLMKENTGRSLFQLRLTANLGASLDTPAKVAKFMVDSQKRSFGKMILEYWINGLLSGPATHSTNLIGNAILAIQHTGIETPLAAGIGAIRHAMGREGERIHIGEVGARLRGIGEALPPALKATGESFQSSTSVLLPGEEARPLPYQTHAELAPNPVLQEGVTFTSLKADAFAALQGLQDSIVATGELVKAGGVEGAPMIGAKYSLTGAIPDIQVRGVTALPLGTIIRAPGRFLSAADSFQRVLNFTMAKNAMAFRVATEEGLTGEAFAARVAEVRNNPTEAQMTALTSEASELTLMAKGGKLLNALQHLAGVEANIPGLGPTPVFKFVTPFIHVAGNIMKQTLVQRTALGAVFSAEMRADLMGKNGNIAQDMAMARMLFGTTLAITMGTLAAQGYASGSGPTDPNDAAMWRLAGNQAHSVRIGDMWYGVQKLGPLGLLMGLSADLYDVGKSASEGDMTEATAHLVHAASQNVLDQSMMKGPADLLRAVQDSDRYGQAYVQGFLSSFVPFSVGMAQMARIADPYSRQTRTLIDAIRNKVPGHLDSFFSDGLLPKRDVWGEEMASPEALIGRGVTGINVTKLSTDPVNIALLDLGISPSKVERSITNVDLTEQEYDDYARIAGRMSKMRLDTIVRSNVFRTMPNHVKHDLIQATITQSRQSARGVIQMKYPHIPRDAVQAQRDRLKD